MSSFKSFVRVSLVTIKSALENMIYLYRNGQNNSSDILKTSHRLEKGMCISNPRELWGWDKAKHLAMLLEKEPEGFAKNTGIAVLNAYIEEKLCGNSEKDIEIARQFKEKFQFPQIVNQPDLAEGGYIEFHHCEKDINAVEELFMNRHSVRDFDDSEVDNNKIRKAIELANRCPSACNRQPTHVYVISDKVWNKYLNDSNKIYGANKHLLITASRTDFSFDEVYDWIVSASIFAGYLTLSLEAVGIAACVIKKGLLNDNAYKKLKSHCGIPEDEKNILEIAIGNFKNSFKVPVSNRKTVDQMFKVVDK